MELWFNEKQTETFGISVRVKETLVTEKTEYQDLAIVDTYEFGRMLTLDGMVMTTIKDEFTYHEMMAHPILAAHPNPRHVLIVGGGDGGVVREVLKHPKVEKVVHVEIDGKVIEYSKKYLPEIAVGLSDPRVEVIVGDGFMHIHENKNKYDVVMVDSTEPIGPAVPLFERGFFQGIYEALKEDGMFVAQTDNPWFKADLIQKVNRDIKEIFPIARLYTANVPTYPSGLWTFQIGSKKHDPSTVELDNDFLQNMETKYYTPAIHKACFALPRFVEELVK